MIKNRNTMIIDCFTFYNELGILKKRLNYLYNHVDHFVLVESTVTHRGEPKNYIMKKIRIHSKNGMIKLYTSS